MAASTMLKFSKLEINELTKAWLGVSLVFAIALTGISTALIISIPIALITGGIAFLLHELAHKFVAQRYKLWAEFRANNQALIIGLLLSLFGVVLLAPGGVYVHGATRQQNGKIAIAGPIMNIILAGVFLALSLITLPTLLQETINYGFRINALLAAFNLIPFPPFDGHSVWQWNKISYLLVAVAAGIFAALSF